MVMRNIIRNCHTTFPFFSHSFPQFLSNVCLHLEPLMLIWITLRLWHLESWSHYEKHFWTAVQILTGPLGKNISKHVLRFSLSAGRRRLLWKTAIEMKMCVYVCLFSINFPILWVTTVAIHISRIGAKSTDTIVSKCLCLVVLPKVPGLVVRLSNTWVDAGEAYSASALSRFHNTIIMGENI